MKKTIFGLLTLLLITSLMLGVVGCDTTDDTVIQQDDTSTSTTDDETTTEPATQTITDMYGTELEVPAEINRVISTGPVETQLIYILAPEKLVGLSNEWNGDPSFIAAEYADIPIIGNASSGSFNYEAAIAVEPDIVLEGKTKNLETDREKFGSIPVVGVDAGSDLLTLYEEEITYVADLLGVPERGEAFIAYYQEAMDYVNGIVSAIPEDERVRVYYAEGDDGLQTDAVGSWHTNLLEFCGGVNVADVEVNNTSQAVQISMEQVYNWEDEEPIDLIIIGRGSQEATYQAIMTSEIWQELDCVEAGEVYVRPDNPTSWFDGPPGYGQILGMYWMVHTLYPEQTADLDLEAKIKEFYSDFLHYDLTDAEVSELLANPS